MPENAAQVEFEGRISKLSFVERKEFNEKFVSKYLGISDKANHWTNFGPLFHLLSERYREHLRLAADTTVTPCASGGIALELLARIEHLNLEDGSKIELNREAEVE